VLLKILALLVPAPLRGPKSVETGVRYLKQIVRGKYDENV
jgi:hypothetical protein